MNFPENVKYSHDHEWIRVEGQEAYVGITDFAQSEIGRNSICGYPHHRRYPRKW